MLNQRQMEVLLSLSKEPDSFFTASYFVEETKVSLRTIQGDIKALKEELANETCACIVSKASKGCCLHIEDYEEFSALMGTLYQRYTNVSLNYPTSRISSILLNLLNRHRPISMYVLENEMHISHSTLSNDLKKVSKILKKFELDLLKSNDKLLIDGAEINKRRCLAEKNMYLAHIMDGKGNRYIDDRQIVSIKNILTEVMVQYGHHIGDTDFKNAILQLNIMIQRITEGFYIAADELEISIHKNKARDISEEVFKRLEKRFHFEVSKEEVEYFALYLKGQGNFEESDIISQEMDQFLAEVLKKIKDTFGIDFTDNINLKIALALHCVPLSIRLRYDMQVKNEMMEYIKKMFPLGYDIATYFAYFMQEKYKKKVSDDENALLAVHFYSALIEIHNAKGNKRVLVISSMKMSMTTLLRQTLLKWFSNHIKVLDFIHPKDMDPDMLDEYDVFLTTEKGEFFDKGLAMFINDFPNNNDYLNIKLNLDGFKSIDDIIQIFNENLFYITNTTTKEEVLSTLVQKAEVRFGLNGLYQAVIEREAVRSTMFCKGIAVPHPIQAISSDTFVVVGISKQPIIWDDDKNTVNLIMMIHVGKNNQRAFQLWDYFSMIFADERFVDRLLENPDFFHFSKLLKKALEDGIQNSDVK